MYDLYVFTTPNCWKTTILAEELGEAYNCKAVVLAGRSAMRIT